MIARGDGDARHGTENGYHNLRCRCDACREAFRVASAERRKVYRNRPWPATTKHGTDNAYLNYGCRCGECRSAHKANRNNRAAK